MERNKFIQLITAMGTIGTLGSFQKFTDELPTQGAMMPVLFTSHGNPMDIPMNREERPFWKALYNLGRSLEKNVEIKAALVISAHWCTRGSFINTSLHQEQIFDYYGFPPETYQYHYPVSGALSLAEELTGRLVKSGLNAEKVTGRGYDHGQHRDIQLELDSEPSPPSLALQRRHAGHGRHGRRHAQSRHRGPRRPAPARNPH